MNFLAPAALGFGALTVPILLLYMLRLRRTDVPISSNLLWRQLVRDREANALWQRLRFSWLMLLQLLILAALVLALARPFIEVETVSAGRIVLLLDASASMTATDVGESRFEQAQQTALDMVETLGGDDAMTVIRVAEVPEVLITTSQNQAELRDAIQDAEPSQSSADWAAALTLASAGANNADDLSIVIVSDGGLSANLPEIAGEIRLVTVGESSENLAITALATRELPGEGPQLFAQITNYGDEDAEVIFDINLDGELFSAQRYEVAAGRHVDVVVEDLPESFNELAAGLVTPAASTVPDYLTIDDHAYTVHNPRGAGRVLLMTERNIFLNQIFSSLPGVELVQGSTEIGMPIGDFDLYVFDGWLPDTLPQSDIFILNPPASTSLFTVDETIESVTAARPTGILRDDPRTQYLNFDNVNIRAFQRISGYEEWADVLVGAESGPLLIAGEVGERQVAVLTFALRDSDLPLQLTWPIMVANLMQWYRPPRILDVGDSIMPGGAIVVRSLAGERVVVTAPNGKESTLELDRSGQVAFADTSQAGIYRVEVQADGEAIAHEAFAVNLFDARESRITPQDSVTIGASTISEAAREETGQRELWQYLALLGLLILLVEWLYYHRVAVRQLLDRMFNRQPSRRVGRI